MDGLLGIVGALCLAWGGARGQTCLELEQPGSSYPTGSDPLHVEAADVDGDGVADLITANDTSNDVTVLPGYGDGTFGSPIRSPAGTGPVDLVAADFDGDGITDLAVAGDALAILIGNGDGTFRPPVAYPGDRRIACADLDGDTDLDIVSGFSDIEILMGNGDGTFQHAGTLQTTGTATLSLRDLDDDGAPDLIITGSSVDYSIRVAFGQGDGTFSGTWSAILDGTGTGVDTGDLDGDEDLDLVVGTENPYSGTGTVSVLVGRGDGTFQPPVVYAIAPTSPRDVDVEDIDGDGDLDACAGASSFMVLRGNGDGTLQPVDYFLVGYSSGFTAVHDLDRNGTLDVATTGELSGTVTVLRNLGLGISPAALPVGFSGTPYTQTLVAAGGSGPFAFSISGGALPPGLSLSLGGALSGTPSAPGFYPFDVSVTDAVPCTTSRSYAIVIDPSPSCGGIVVLPPTLPQAFVGAPYGQALAAAGGTAPYGFLVVQGALPPGLSLTPAGWLSGVPTSSGTYDATIAAVDALGCIGVRDQALRVTDCPAITITPPSLPSGTVGLPYAQTLGASGGRPPHTFAVTSGSLPAGLTLASTGVLSGTPASPGASSFTVTATDTVGCAGSLGYVLTIDPAPPPVPDYILGRGHGPPNPNEVRVFTSQGNATTVEFHAYAAGGYGVNVTSGRVSGGAFDRILTGPGPGPACGPQVRAFDPGGMPMGKINFNAYGTPRYGVNLAAGDLDRDGFDEIVTGPGPGASFGPHVRAWNFDGQQLTAIAKVNFFAYGTLKYGAAVASGDFDGDDFDEMLTGPGPGPTFADTVRGWNFDGAPVAPLPNLSFRAYGYGYGVIVAAGDVDADGYEEIGTAPGPGPLLAAIFRGFDYDAVRPSMMPGFEVQPFLPWFYGGRVGAFDADDDGAADLLCGAGPDPGAGATVLAFTYTGTSLQQLAATPILPFAGDYGVNAAAGRLGI